MGEKPDSPGEALDRAAREAGIAIPAERREAILRGAQWLRECMQQIADYLRPAGERR